MERPKLDFNKLAGTYHQRYADNKLDGIEAALLDLARSRSVERVLEVGCGTGRWIESLRITGAAVFGADASTGMIEQGARRLGPQRLIAATANRLPFDQEYFDLIFAVNAVHHFDDAQDFIRQARYLLRPNGVLALVGIDPRSIRRRYYYEHFEGAWGLDIARYPSFGELVDCMIRAGLNDVEMRVVDRYSIDFTGKEILDDPFLVKESNSLLALLDDKVYRAGLQRIESAIDRDPLVQFRSELTFLMITGVVS
jgi:SAM-dependent methyltransferase